LVAALESAEALKLLTGHMDQLNRRLVTADLWRNQYGSMDLSRMGPDPDCPACGHGRLDFLEGTQEKRAGTLCGRNAVQISSRAARPVDFEPIARRLSAAADVTYNEFLLKAAVGKLEIALFRDGRAIVRGTQDIQEARIFYSRILGD